MKQNIQKLSPTLTLYQRIDIKTDNWHVQIKLPRQSSDDSRTKYKHESLHTNNLIEAIAKAQKAELEIQVRKDNDIPIHTKSFEAAYREWIKTALAFKTESRRQNHLSNGERYFFEYFNKRDLSRLDELYIEGYWQWRMKINAQRASKGKLSAHSKLIPSSATLYMERDSLSQFFKWAVKRNLIKRKFELEMPVKNQRNRRPAFTLEEYVQLRRGMRKWANSLDSYVHRTQFYQRQLVHYAFRFCMASGLRPRELFLLRWKDVSYFQDDTGMKQMLISVSPQTKTKGRECVPTTESILILQRWHDGIPMPDGRTCDLAIYKSPDDFIFPNFRGGFYVAHERATKKMFVDCELLTDSHGRERTFYSGRHVYATFRLLYGEGIDAYRLAKNMGTSVEMIEKHYGHMENKQNAILLTSRRKRVRRQIYDQPIDADNIIHFPTRRA